MKEDSKFSFFNTIYDKKKLLIGYHLFPLIELDINDVFINDNNNPLVDDKFKEPVVIQHEGNNVLMCCNKDFLFDSAKVKKFRLGTKYSLKKLVYIEGETNTTQERSTPRYSRDSYGRSDNRSNQRRDSSDRSTNRRSSARRANGSA